MRLKSLALMGLCLSVSATGQPMQQAIETAPGEAARMEELLSATQDWRDDEIVLLPRDPQDPLAPSFPFPVTFLDPDDPRPLEEQARDMLDLDEEDLALLPPFDDVFNVVDPITLPTQLGELTTHYTNLCGGGVAPKYCAVARQLEAFSPGLGDTDVIARCGAAANALSAAAVPGERYWYRRPEARAWENACLTSLGSQSPDGVPDETLMTAVGILHLGETPRCSGLLTPDGRFVTAKHCVGGPPYDFLRVRQAGTDEVRTLEHVRSAGGSGVSNDWAIFRIVEDPPLVVPEVEFGRFDPGDPGYPIGFSFVSADRLRPLARMADAVRTPRKDMCRVVFDLEDCLHLACQTMPGFSGSPIFARSGPERPATLIGILSGGDDGNTKCGGGRTIQRVTFAVPASRIEQ